MTHDFPLLDELNEPVAIVDSEFKVVYVNKYFYTFSKITPRIIASRPLLSEIFHHQDFDFEKSQQETVIQKKPSRSNEINLVVIKSTKNYRGIVKLIPITHENQPYLMWSFLDFTNEFELQNKYRKQLTELNHNHNQLMQANKHKAIGEVYETLSHDINNPLTSSVFCLDKLKNNFAQKKLDVKDSKKLVDKISFQVQTVTEIVCNMKNYLTQNTSHKEYIDLIDVITKSKKLAKTLKIFDDLDFTLRMPAGPAIAWGNQTELVQVMINILKNAAEALATTDSDEKHIEISFSEEIEEQQYKIIITDNGPGIDPSLLDNIFTPFSSSKSPDEGTGLGLSIVSKIIEDHDGQINVSVCQEGQTSFTILLPTVELSSFVNNNLFSKLDNGRPQIVLLLDNLKLINKLNNALTEANFLVMITNSIDCQQDVFTDFVPDLIITTNKEITSTQVRTKLMPINSDDDIELLLEQIKAIL